MEARPLKIFSETESPRLRYIAGIIMEDIMGLSWEITTDRRKLGKSYVINYSDESISGAFNIRPDSLLYESGIKSRTIDITYWNELPVFFSTSDDSDLPFDIFAAAFFLVSRYEEYLDFKADEHGRFPASSSLAYRNGFLLLPLIDLWTNEMSKALLKKFINLAFKRNDYKALLTVDIDQPWAYLGKSILRSIGGIFRDLKNSSGNIGERYRTLTQGENDPYEVFDYIYNNIEEKSVDAKFFFPVGNHSEHDKNPSWKNEEYRDLILKINGKFEIGLHPSYFAAEDFDILKRENTRLQTIIGKEINLSRFHFVRLFTPVSYQNVIKSGIYEDYSMGYPEEPGFRASLARPYYFYDISGEKQTKLRIVPFQIMDVTLYNYKKLDPAESKEAILNLINVTRKVGGSFVSIWHNTSLLENEEWKDWRDVFEFMLSAQMP